MSTNWYPKTNGAPEIMNKIVENNLRCYWCYYQDYFNDRFAAPEVAYNSSVTEGLCMSPFLLDLGWSPKTLLDFICGTHISLQGSKEFKKALNTSLEGTVLGQDF